MSRKQKGIYLAGPMTGLPQDNHPAFLEAAGGLEKMGWSVHNPATSYNGAQDLPYRLFMSAAINLLCQADAIALMDGWTESRGAKMEALIAQRLDLPFYNAHTGRRMYVEDLYIRHPIMTRSGHRPFPRNEELLRQLVPIARDLAEEAGGVGITVTDVRLEALNQGVLSGEEHPYQLSVLGHVCRRAGLVNFEETRRSTLDVTHGIRQTIWYTREAA